MLCEKCGKNEATVHYSEIINGKKTTYTLCDECAEEMGIGHLADPFDSFSAQSLLSGFFGDAFGSAPARERQRLQSEKRCPVCGATLREIAEAGKVGCAECYRTFRDELRSTIRRIHGSVSYKGTQANACVGDASGAPSAAGSAPSVEAKPKSEADSLRAELYEAIKNEDFERAAVLRDRIKALGE